MTVDPTLWQAFHTAKDALLEALRSDIETSCLHFLSQHHAERTDALSAKNQTIIESKEWQRQLESAKDDLSAMIGLITVGAQRIRQSMSPIGVLPPELLREVVLHSVDQRSHEDILTLASVCGLWRDAVHAERSLFAEANWDDWHIELLDLWSQRSRGCPLHVRINSSVAHRFDDDHYVRVLQTTVSRWASLSLYDFNGYDDSSTRTPLREFFLQNSLESLNSLAYSVPLDDRFELVAPNLITMQCHGGLPIFTSSTQPRLERVLLQPETCGEWGFAQTFLTSYHSLTDLHIDFVSMPDVEEWSSPLELTFASLRHLRMECAYSRDIIGAFRLCKFPVLQEITLGHRMVDARAGDGSDEVMTTLDFLSSRAPCVQRLHLFEDRLDRLACDLVLGFLSNHPSVFPMLCDLGMSVHSFRPPYRVRARYPDSAVTDNVKHFVASRKVMCLSIPCLSEACIEDIQSAFGTICTSAPALAPDFYPSTLRSLTSWA